MARYRRSRRGELLVFLLVALVILLLRWQWPAPSTDGGRGVPRRTGAPQDSREADALPAGTYQVARVIDGDTLRLVGHARVRLQGIDSPEIAGERGPAQSWSAEATRFTAAFVEAAQ